MSFFLQALKPGVLHIIILHEGVSCDATRVPSHYLLQVYGQDGGQLAGLEHPEKGSLAWQWVQKNLSHNGTATYTIKLALESGAGNLSKRQSATDGEMAAFFDDINVDAQLSTPPPTETEG